LFDLLSALFCLIILLSQLLQRTALPWAPYLRDSPGTGEPPHRLRPQTVRLRLILFLVYSDDNYDGFHRLLTPTICLASFYPCSGADQADPIALPAHYAHSVYSASAQGSSSDAALPFNVVNLRYDLTPIGNISVVATETGLTPPTSIPVLMREIQSDLLQHTQGNSKLAGMFFSLAPSTSLCLGSTQSDIFFIFLLFSGGSKVQSTVAPVVTSS